jgi:hypothetical protein
VQTDLAEVVAIKRDIHLPQGLLQTECGVQGARQPDTAGKNADHRRLLRINEGTQITRHTR